MNRVNSHSDHAHEDINIVVDYYYYLLLLRMRHSQGKMYIGHSNLCVCLCVCLSLTTFPHYCTDPDVTWGNGRGALQLCTIGGFAIGARVSLL